MNARARKWLISNLMILLVGVGAGYLFSQAQKAALKNVFPVLTLRFGRKRRLKPRLPGLGNGSRGSKPGLCIATKQRATRKTDDASFAAPVAAWTNLVKQARFIERHAERSERRTRLGDQGTRAGSARKTRH